MYAEFEVQNDLKLVEEMIAVKLICVILRKVNHVTLGKYCIEMRFLEPVIRVFLSLKFYLCYDQDSLMSDGTFIYRENGGRL